MAAIAALGGRALGTASTHYLEAVAGVVGVGVGASPLVGQVAVLGLV